MAFDSTTRNKLANLVTRCRGRLVEEFSDQFQQFYGIVPKEGTVAALDSLTHLDESQRETARQLHEVIDYYAEGLTGSEPKRRKEAIDRLLREQAFTVLNRLAALRMAEERGIVQECVRQGMKSDGFQLFEVNAGTDLGDAHDRYVTFIECIYDELSLDLGVLFDRFSPHGLLFPGSSGLQEVLDFLGDADIKRLWAEDETIGWIYQYWNSKEERKAMRDASAAPRNSRELAVRNQFFTPRYVVEFLTDNTLGRIWYEMTKGETRLKDQCRYLVRRPMEIFLPDPETNFWHDAEGTEGFREFSRSGSVDHLPEDPILGVLFGWVGPMKTLGFEEELRVLGFTHQEVMERHLGPLEDRQAPRDIAEAHPIVLLHILWRLAYESSKNGYGDLPSSVSDDPIAGPTWTLLREKLANPEQELSQEQLLKQPVFIPHRPMKDPREIRLLDPACGSMHFGLYAFDLFETIYAEAWQLGTLPRDDFGADKPPFSHASVRKKAGLPRVRENYSHQSIDAATARVVILENNDPGDGLGHEGAYLREPGGNFRPAIVREMLLADFDYAKALAEGWITKQQGERLVRETDAFEHARCEPMSADEVEMCFHHDVPRLIIEHNIHGVDIDPRAVQIAGLSLWLRAQKSWRDTPAAERPRVRRSNIVCAEPMPGSEEMLEEFVQTLDPPLLGEFVKTVFDKMQLAGEAGTLLKIEEEIRTAIDDAKAKWEKLGAAGRDLFSAEELNKTLRPGAQQELSGIEKALSSDLRPLGADFFDTAEERIYAALSDYAESAEAGDYQRRLFAEDAAHGFAFIDLCRKRYDAVVMNPPFGAVTGGALSYIRKAYPIGYIDLYTSFIDRGAELNGRKGITGAITSRTAFFLSSFEKWRRSRFLGATKIKTCIDLGQGVLDGAMVETAAYTVREAPSNESSLFFDLTDIEDRQSRLYQCLGDERAYTFLRNAESLLSIPRATIAYSLDPNLLEDFHRLSPLSKTAEICRGSATSDDERFVRLVWEIPNHGLLPSADRAWRWLSKGGEFSAFYSSIHLALDWRKDGDYLGQYMYAKRPRNGILWGPSSWSSKFIGKPGVVWPLRSQRGLSFRLLPADCAFSHKSPVAMTGAPNIDYALVAILNTQRIQQLAECVTTFGSYEMGAVGSLPVDLSNRSEFTDLGERGYDAVRLAFSTIETDPYFSIQTWRASDSLEDFATKRSDRIAHWDNSLRETISGANEKYRDVGKILDTRHEDILDTPKEENFGVKFVSEAVGFPLGRWDIRYATGERHQPELPDPFDPLPVCPPGMLQNADGLPAAPADVPDDYPLRITWPGVLVDDENHPSEDIVARVRDALAVIWGDRSAAIEQEACEILGVRTLRDYFAEKKSGGKFFKDHLKRYSKSRRQAPIYWPLSTESGSYTLWIYYHRLTGDTLYTAVSGFVEPKIASVSRDLDRLTAKGDQRTTTENKDWERLTDLSGELQVFRDELLRIANLPWKPNLNDGVQITAAPLWSLFRNKAWQKKLKDTWKALEKGDYDWAHQAHTLWPERVIPKCATDRSLAIAHDHESDLWEEVTDAKGKTKWQPKPDAAEIAQQLVEQHQN